MRMVRKHHKILTEVYKNHGKWFTAQDISSTIANYDMGITSQDVSQCLRKYHTIVETKRVQIKTGTILKYKVV